MKLGHNERSYRLDVLAEEARKGLQSVEQGEEATIGGWLAYGHALNEGRALFPSDREFGEWIQCANLAQWNGNDVDRHDRAAAMWAAANADQFEEARQRGNPRTIRGIHAKWKEIEREREQAEWEEQQRKAAEERKAATETPPAEQAAPEGAAPSAKVEAATDAVEDVASGGGESSSAPAPDRNADLRAEFRAMTNEAQEEDWINLRLDFAEGQKRIASQRGEIAELKARIKELTESEQGRAIGTLQRRLSQSEGRSKEHQANAARLQRQVNAQKNEIKKLRDRLEAQEVTL